MACRRGRCVRWQARSPYPTDERAKASRRAGGYGLRYRSAGFTEIEVEVLLDWHSEMGNPCRLSLQSERNGSPVNAQSPPNWLIAESSKAYAFTVQRPGDVGLSPEDVEVQVEIKGKGSAGACSESWAERASCDDGGAERAERDSLFVSTSGRVQRSVSRLLTIFCEKLGSNCRSSSSSNSNSNSSRSSSNSSRSSSSAWDSPCEPCSGSWEEDQEGGFHQSADTPIHHSCTGAPRFGDAMASPGQGNRDSSRCDCVACLRAASGLPWKFGRRFSLPLDADAERAFAAHANGTLTVLVPRTRQQSRTYTSWMPPSASPSGAWNGPTAHPHGRDGFPGSDGAGPEKRWMLHVNSMPRGPTHWPSFPEDVVWDAMREFMSSAHAFPSPGRPFPAWEHASSGSGRGTGGTGQESSWHMNPSHMEDDAMDICV